MYKNKLLTDQVRCDTKETIPLYSYIEAKSVAENFRTVTKDSTKLRIFKRVKGKKIFFEISDVENENLFEIEIYTQRRKLYNTIKEWSRKQFLGLTYGLWGIIFIVILALIPLIVVLAPNVVLNEERKLALRILGILLICSGIVGLLTYMTSNYFLLKKFAKIRIQIQKDYERLVLWISRFSASSTDKKICWKCYEEISINKEKCPKCGTEL